MSLISNIDQSCGKTDLLLSLKEPTPAASGMAFQTVVQPASNKLEIKIRVSLRIYPPPGDQTRELKSYVFSALALVWAKIWIYTPSSV
jgi:hypothetical protein